MVMVIVAIVILSTIGLAILSLSLDNYRLSLFDRTSICLFMAESVWNKPMRLFSVR